MNGQRPTTNGKRVATQEPLSVQPFLKTRLTNRMIPVNGNFSGGLTISNSGGGVNVFNDNHRDNNKLNDHHDNDSYNNAGNDAGNNAGNDAGNDSNNINNSNQNNNRNNTNHSNNSHNRPNDKEIQSNIDALQHFSSGIYADSDDLFESLMEIEYISEPFRFKKTIKTKTDLELWEAAMGKAINKIKIIKNDELDKELIETALDVYGNLQNRDKNDISLL